MRAVNLLGGGLAGRKMWRSGLTCADAVGSTESESPGHAPLVPALASRSGPRCSSFQRKKEKGERKMAYREWIGGPTEEQRPLLHPRSNGDCENAMVERSIPKARHPQDFPTIVAQGTA